MKKKKWISMAVSVLLIVAIFPGSINSENVNANRNQIQIQGCQADSIEKSINPAVATSPSLYSPNPGIGPAIGTVISVIGLGYSIISSMEGPDKPSAKIITDLDMSTTELRVGDTAEIVGKAEVNLGHVVDCGVFDCDYHDAYVTITAKVESTGKIIPVTYIYSNLAKADEYFGYGRWGGSRPYNLVYVAGDDNMKVIEFSFTVEGVSDLKNNGNDKVTITVEVIGAEATWGYDPIKVVSVSKTKPFKVLSPYTFKIESDPKTKKVKHGEEYSETLYVTNLTTTDIWVCDVEMGEEKKEVVKVPKNQTDKSILSCTKKHTERHSEPGTVKDAIKIEPRKFTIKVNLKSTKPYECPVDLKVSSADCEFAFIPEEMDWIYDEWPTVPPTFFDPKVEGTIVDDETGLGIQGATVTLTRLDKEEVLTTATDGSGYFSFDVEGGGFWSLGVDMVGYLPLEMLLTVSEDTSLGTIGLIRELLFIQGIVVDDTGDPVQAIVTFIATECYSGFTDQSGDFSIFNVPYGATGTLRVCGNEFAKFYKEVTKEMTVTENLELGAIVLQREPLPDPPQPATLRGVVTSMSGRTPIAGAVIEVVNAITGATIASQTTDEMGRWEFVVNTGTTVCLVATAEGKEVKTEAILIPGDLYFHRLSLPITFEYTPTIDHLIAVTDSMDLSPSVKETILPVLDYVQEFLLLEEYDITILLLEHFMELVYSYTSQEEITIEQYVTLENYTNELIEWISEQSESSGKMVIL